MRLTGAAPLPKDICLGRKFHLPRDCPHESCEFPCDCGDGNIGIFSFDDELSIPFAQAQLSLPGDVLDDREQVFLTFLDNAGDFRRISVGPCAFDERSSRMAVSRLGDSAEAPLAAAGVLAWNETQVSHELPGIVEAGEIAHFGDDGDGDGELDTTECLKSFDDRVETPGCGELLQFGLEMSETFGMLRDGSDVFLENDLLSRRRADDFGEPAKMCLVPVRFSDITDVEAKEKGLEPELGGFQIGDCVLSSPAEVPDCFVFEPGDIDWVQIAGPHETGELNGIAGIGLDPIPRSSRNQGWSDHVTQVVLSGEEPIEAVPAWAGFIGKDKRRRFGMKSADKLVDVALAGADVAKKDHLGGPVVGRIGDGYKFFMDIHTDEKRGILFHG